MQAVNNNNILVGSDENRNSNTSADRICHLLSAQMQYNQFSEQCNALVLTLKYQLSIIDINCAVHGAYIAMQIRWMLFFFICAQIKKICDKMIYSAICCLFYRGVHLFIFNDTVSGNVWFYIWKKVISNGLIWHHNKLCQVSHCPWCADLASHHVYGLFQRGNAAYLLAWSAHILWFWSKAKQMVITAASSHNMQKPCVILDV